MVPYVCHHAIVVSANDIGVLETVRNAASQIYFPSHLVTSIMHSHMNGVCTFFVAPDGSLSGFYTSKIADEARVDFIKHLKDTNYLGVTWAEVEYGHQSDLEEVEYDSDQA
jgi:hypothetical protein